MRMLPFRCGRRRPRKPARWSLTRSSYPCGNTSSTPCWARSASTTRATSLSKGRYCMSGMRTASTCNWSEAWPRNNGRGRSRPIFPDCRRSSASAEYFPTRGGLNMVCRKLLILSAIMVALYATTAAAEILIGVAGPMTGKDAWFGEQLERGAALAVADLNAAGGVLGQQVQLVAADDYCDPEQAVAAARKLVSDGVIFVVGHYCSGASIPASEIYDAAGGLFITPPS